jgi:DNA (cytosine-5)-methyltransferase 1
MNYSVASLFAGVGGLCSAFKRSKLEIEGKKYKYNLLWANEFDKEAIKTYKYNYNHTLIEGDIEEILDISLVTNKRNYLVKRQAEIEDDLEKYIVDYDIKFVKKIVNSLKKNYIENAMKGIKIEPSKNLKKSIENYYDKEYKEKINFEEFEENLFLIAESIIIEEELKEKNVEWLEKREKELKSKQDSILEKPVDIVNGGFPCQAFSVAGDAKGFKDHRGELFYSFVNLINLLQKKGYSKPRVLLLENVKNLISHDKGNTFKVITGELEKLGYKLKYKVLNTYKYSTLPQNRERIFILAFLNQEDFDMFGSFDDLKEIKSSKEYRKEWTKDIIDYNTSFNTHSEFYYTKEKYPHYFGENEIDLEKDIIKPFEFYQLRRGMYVRENASGVCPTLTANMGTGGHNVPLIKVQDGIRKLTPEECFRLQGFRVGTEFNLPPNVSKANLYKQAGNAVSVDVVERITTKLLETLAKVDSIKK